MRSNAVCWCVLGSCAFFADVNPWSAALAAAAEPPVVPPGPGTESADESSAQRAAEAAAQSAPATPGDAAASAAAADERSIRFNFKGATFDQVIDFFARATGLPVVWQTEAPAGTLDYLSPESYTVSEALTVLNIVLQSKGVMLRVDKDMLYLQQLTQMQRQNIPTFVGELPETVTDDQLVTVVRPLSIASAEIMAERLAGMVAAYGSVVPIPQQNALVITETAAQVRRLSIIIDEIDRGDPEGQVEIIRLEHVDATAMMVPLQALLGQRVERYVINERGRQTLIEEDQMPGLNITPDTRTNSLIARGTIARIQQLRDAIRLLDVPEGAQTRAMRTVSLSRLVPSQAVQRVQAIFARLPEQERPIFVPIDEFSRLTIIGNDRSLAEATAFLREADGGLMDEAGGQAGAMSESTVLVVPVERASARPLVQAITSLLTRRQQAVLTVTPGADDRSVVLAGPRGDVERVASIVPSLDRAARVERDVRLLRMDAPGAERAVARATELYGKAADAEDPAAEIAADFDTDSRTLTLVGSRAAIERYVAVLRSVEQVVSVDRETRRVEVSTTPSRMLPGLRSMAQSLLKSDGPRAAPPEFEAIDPLDLLIIRAAPEDFAVLGALIEALDRPDPSEFAVRIVSVASVSDPEDLLARAGVIFDRVASARRDGELPKPTIDREDGAAHLLLSGPTQSVQAFESALSEARQLMPALRSGEFIEVQAASAGDLVEPLRALVARAIEVDGGRLSSPPRIEAVAENNSLFVVAEPAQHAIIRRLVADLDRVEPAQMPPLRMLQVRAADAVRIADLLRARYDARSADVRRLEPVNVIADAPTNTLVVTAPDAIFTEIRSFVEEINSAGEGQAERTTMIFALRRARATDVAAALERLYPDPPMPLDRLGRPLPNLREPREIYVSADAGTNTLIVEAPSERRASFEALVDQLDRVELPARAVLRTYRIDRGDPETIARTLTDLARQGVMAQQPEDGSPPVQVLFRAEQLSRTLIVAGDDVTFAQVDAMLRELQAVPPRRSLRVFEVTAGNPRDISERALRLYREQVEGDTAAGEVTVEVDGNNGTLLVVAEDEAMVRFARIVDQLEQAAGIPPELQLVPLEHAKAEEVVEFLRELVDSHFALSGTRSGAAPQFEPVSRTNSLLVAARRDEHEIIRALIGGIDKPQSREMPPLRILRLRSADADNLAGALNRKYAQRPVEDRSARPVDITADPLTNSLIVAAHPDLLEDIQGVVETLNETGRHDTDGRTIRIFPLRVARAEELGRTLAEMFPEPPVPIDARGRPMPHLRPPREVVVRADVQMNALIVDAPGHRMAGFEQLVEQLDRQHIGATTEIRTYPIVHADPVAISGTLRGLSQSGALSPDGSDRRTPITITADVTSRSIVISGPAVIFERVESVLADLDVRPQGPATRLRMFTLQHARAEAMAEMLRGLLSARLEEELPEAAVRMRSLLSVTADRKTNTLIISAPDSILHVAEELIRQLDVERAAVGDAIIRIRSLTFADAGTIATSLGTAMSGMVSRSSGDAFDVRLIPAPGSNALILIGPERELDEVEQMIEPLDARPATDALDARTYALVHADASAIAPVVQRLLVDQQATDPRFVLERMRRSRGQVDLIPPIRVETDRRTNSLIISGPQTTVALAETLIEQLDRPGELADRAVRSFTPQQGDPAELARTVRSILEAGRGGGRPPAVELVTGAQSRTVLVIGDDAEVGAALELLRERDAQTLVAPAMELRVLDVKHGAASAIADAMRPLLTDVSRWPESLRAVRQAGVSIAQPSVTAEPGGDRVLVVAPQPLIPLAQMLLEELDRPRSAAASADIRVFTLQRAEAGRAAEAVRTALEGLRRTRPGWPEATVTPEPSSNAIVVTAMPEQLDVVEDVVRRLDEGQAVDRAQVRTIFLEHARAASVAQVVEQLLSRQDADDQDLPAWMRRQMAEQRAQDPSQVRVAADERLNAVMVAAPAATLDLAQELIERLDIEASAGDRAPRRVHVLSLRNADAQETAESIRALFDDDEERDRPPVVRVDAASNVLLVRATDSQAMRIREVVEGIDRATIAVSRDLRVIRVDPDRADAQDVADALRRMLDRDGGGSVEVMTLEELLRRTRSDAGESSAPAPAGAGSLLMPGSRDPAALLLAAIRAGAIGLVHTARAPAHAEFDDDADVAAPAHEADSAERTSTSSDALAPQRRDLTPRISIAVDRETNSIVIVGAPREIERVETLARRLELRLPAPADRLRVVTLPADVPARTVAAMVTGTLQRLRPADGERGELARRVSVQADEATNALVITSSDRDFAQVAELVAALSRVPEGESRVVKLYPLRTITADRAQRSVRGLLEVDPATGRRGQQADRMRPVAVRLMGGEVPFDAVFNPARVSIVAEPEANMLLVSAPAEAIAFIDRYIELIDQSSTEEVATLRVFPLKHARASELRGTLGELFRTRVQNLRDQGAGRPMEPQFTADERTNMLLVTASPEQLAEVDRLLERLDVESGDAAHPLRIVRLRAATATSAASLLDRAVIGADQRRRADTMVLADDGAGLLLVRADEAVNAEIDRVLEEIDRDSVRELPVRTLTLARADARAVSEALQRFFDDRARIASEGRGRRAQVRSVSIIGDATSRTLLIAANDSDFAEIETLVERFDAADATTQWTFRVFPLRHARATQISQTVEQIVDSLIWGGGPFIWNNPRAAQRDRGTVAVNADDRLNALVVAGEGEQFEIVASVIEALDAPQDEGEQRAVRVIHLRHVQTSVVEPLVRSIFDATPRQRGWWEPATPARVQISANAATGTLIIVAPEREQEEIAQFIAAVDIAGDGTERETDIIAIQFAPVREIAATLDRFLRARTDTTGRATAPATIVPSEAGGTLLVAGIAEDLALVRDLVGRLDQPDVSGDRAVEIVALKRGSAAEIGRILREQLGGRGGSGIIVTPDARTNSLVINAPRRQFGQAMALIEQLDSRGGGDETVIRTYSLESARADEVVQILAESLQLDARGQTTGSIVRLEDAEDAVEVRGRIVADRRSNSVIVTATPESIPVIAALIAELDDVPAAASVGYHIVRLQHAMADDVVFTLRAIGDWGDARSRPNFDYIRSENQLVVSATPDQYEQISRIVAELDLPSERQRLTDIVALRFAEAEKLRAALSVFYGPYAMDADTPGKRTVRIVADQATNSLVISADQSEWTSIRALLERLDSEEYDASLQLRVLPLVHADARSVARAINEAFAGAMDASRGGGRAERQPAARTPAGGGDGRPQPEQQQEIIIESEDWVRASAEPVTNSIIVSAGRTNLRKIEDIVRQIDVADYARLPAVRLIRITRGDAQAIATSISRMFEDDDRSGTRGGVRIVGDRQAGALIVRVEDEQFEQIAALADALQQQAGDRQVDVEIIRLTAAPARRVADALLAAYQIRVREDRLPLTIHVDASSNSLVVATTEELFRELRATAGELDALVPGAGQAIFIIDLQHVTPDAARGFIESIGLHQPPREDSAARMVSEPVRVISMRGRNAVAVVANPADRDTVVSVLKAFDAEPMLAEARVRVIRLKHAAAPALVRALSGVLDPSSQQANTELARAAVEQVRRISVQRDGINEQPLALDLSLPIRVVAEEQTNSVVLSATTDGNLAAAAELVRIFDAVPLTDAVTVQIIPLENISAQQFAQIVRELFQQGKRLGTVPGTNITGVPGGMVGRALLDEVAISIDERTNTLVVAGKEESVAFVEVLRKRLDSEVPAGWLEPRIVPLRYADATELAESIDAILVRGVGTLPQSTPFTQQIGRLRMLRRDAGNADAPSRFVDSEIFQPMTRLVVRAEPQLNALVLVGTPVNLDLVNELVLMLDVEAASPDSSVRMYPIRHASAARLQGVVERMFEGQVRTRALRQEDRVTVQADERTNTLIVSTSPRSFAVLEALLRTLDAEVAPDLKEIRIVQLESAAATRLAPIMQQLMDARLERIRRVQPETADLERATIVADPRSNAIIVAAGNEAFEVIQRLASELDTVRLADVAGLEVLSVSLGNADRIAQTINAVMDRRYADLPVEVRNTQKPLVLTDPRTNSLLIAANPEDLTSIRSLVERLEAAPTDPAVGVHVINLPARANADALAPRVQRLMRDRVQSLGQARRPSDAVTIESDPQANVLIVAASRENFEVIEGLVQVLVDAGSDQESGRVFDIIPVTINRADQILPLVEELYVRDANERRGARSVQVTADERSNSLLVRAAASDVEVIRDLVRQLDGARSTMVVEVKYVPLQSANALETVGLINNILTGRLPAGRRQAGAATVLRYLSGLEGAPEDDSKDVEISSAIRDSITLTPDVRTNTVIVSAPGIAMPMIERMIRDLDQSSTGAKAIRIFKLENADAVAMREILTDLFNLRQGRELLVLKPREGGEPMPAVDGALAPAARTSMLGGELTAVPDERQQLSITVDSRTNSLLVSGTPTYLELVDEVVRELDSREANEREVFVYQLRNAQAENVATVLAGFVQEEQRKLVSTLSTDQIGSAARLLEREITIQGDDKSNSVLISASPRYLDTVKRMLNQLDVDPPQVLIQVMLAEVTLDDSSDFGFDISTDFDVGSSAVNAGFGFASAFVTGMGVPNISVANSDFNLLLRAMQSQGRLQVLSNPSIMAANNEQAVLQVGETIRVPLSSNFTDGGNINTQTVERELGVVLTVIPSINPDGFVRMQVEPRIDNLTQRTTQITENLESPVITVRRAQTTVTVRDGQTIVLGGLISDRFERRTRKVPFLGDLPLIGLLFRSESEVSAKTEFLIVLTPHVIHSPSDFDRVTELTGGEIDRLSLPERIRALIREGRFDVSGGLYDAEGNPIPMDSWEEEEGPRE